MRWRSVIGVTVIQLLATTFALQLSLTPYITSTQNNSFPKLIEELTDVCAINVGEISKPKILNESFKSLRISTQRVTSKGGTENLQENCLQPPNDIEIENNDNYDHYTKYFEKNSLKKQGLPSTNRVFNERLSTFEKRRFNVRQNERRSRSQDTQIRRNSEIRLQNRKFDRRNIYEAEMKKSELHYRINERRVNRHENTRSLIMDRRFRDSPIRQDNRNENRRERETSIGKRNNVLKRTTRDVHEHNRRLDNIQQSLVRKFRETRENEILNKENKRISSDRILTRRENERSDIRNENRRERETSIGKRNNVLKRTTRDVHEHNRRLDNIQQSLMRKFRETRENEILNKRISSDRILTRRENERSDIRNEIRTLSNSMNKRENFRKDIRDVLVRNQNNEFRFRIGRESRFINQKRTQQRQSTQNENRIERRMDTRFMTRNSQIRERKNLISARLTNEFIRQDISINQIRRQAESISKNLNERRLLNIRKSNNEERFNPSHELKRSEKTIENRKSLLDINNYRDLGNSNERRLEKRTDLRIATRRSNSERRNRENTFVRNDQRVRFLSDIKERVYNEKMVRSTVIRSRESDIILSSKIRKNQVREIRTNRKNEQDIEAKRQTSSRNIFSIRTINKFENHKNNMDRNVEMINSQKLSKDSSKSLVKNNISIQNNRENSIWESILNSISRVDFFISDKENISNQPAYEKFKFKTIFSNSLMLGIFSFQMAGLIKRK